MDRWLAAALDYLPRWLEHQMRLTEQPGCALAVAYRGKLVLEAAFGHADLARGEALTPRHRFRVASHSKSFTAAGVLKLREQGRVRLDDPVGRFVDGLHPQVASATLAQLLSHSAGLVRDGADAGQWADRRPFLDAAGVRADLADGPVIDPNTRLKYSNHGYALAGLAIEAITGEPYADWIAREIVAAAGLRETTPDAPIDAGVPFARGHSAKWPLGRRVVIPGDNPTRALAAATGFVSTAGDLARFYAGLAPDAARSVLGADSRREMWRRQWHDAHSSLDRWYGLGTISGTLADWEWHGHTGGFQGTITRTACVPAQGLTVSVLTNAADGASHGWVDGALHLLRAYRQHGAPSRRTAPWTGRWWSLWGAVDLLPVDGKVLVANPALPNPLQDATELGIDAPGRGTITLAGGFGSHGEPVRLERDAKGRATAFWLGGTRTLPEAAVAKELVARYDATPRAAHGAPPRATRSLSRRAPRTRG
ncbi:MAG: serine hydrolase domain-containing protein [Pseudomonadota bacterium]